MLDSEVAEARLESALKALKSALVGKPIKRLPLMSQEVSGKKAEDSSVDLRPDRDRTNEAGVVEGGEYPGIIVKMRRVLEYFASKVP